MNRLVLIGNGFDLAHGLETSTNHLISYYFLNILNILKREKAYGDELIDITQSSMSILPVDTKKEFDIENSIECFKKYKDDIKSINVKFKSMLLLQIYLRVSSLQWVDVEYLYYKNLKKKITDYSSNPAKEIKDFFKQFEELKKQFITYLKTLGTEKIDKNNCNVCFDKMGNIFSEDIDSNEILYEVENKNLEDVCLVNFNYTPLPESYLRHIDKKHNPSVIYIHGDLQEKHGKPIYGFGDEFDEQYHLLEKREDTSILRDIKSFQYLLNDNYANLMKFIDANEFQVQIMGHSCGLSDRTLLKQIFEHENCKSIKIYYHKRKNGTTDYVDKTYELSRHFSNKQEFRRKLVPFDRCSPMPQNK